MSALDELARLALRAADGNVTKAEALVWDHVGAELSRIFGTSALVAHAQQAESAGPEPAVPDEVAAVPPPEPAGEAQDTAATSAPGSNVPSAESTPEPAKPEGWRPQAVQTGSTVNPVPTWSQPQTGADAGDAAPQPPAGDTAAA